MSFLLPFLVGTVVGGIVTWQVDRRRQQGESGQSLTGWFSRKNDHTSSPEPQLSGTASPTPAPSSPDSKEATDTGSQSESTSQTPHGAESSG